MIKKRCLAAPLINSSGLIDRHFLILGMKQMMGFLRKRLAKVFAIKLLYRWIIVRTSLDRLLVILIQTFDTLFPDLIVCSIWLATACDTATAASHDFDEIEVRLLPCKLILTDLVEKRLRIGHSMDDSDTHFLAIHVDLASLHFIKTSYKLHLDILSFFACNAILCSSYSCFHDTACDTKDSTCACILSKRAISLRLREITEIKTTGSNQPCDLACREDKIDILCTG